MKKRKDRALKKNLRIYLDTSVFGGCFDEEFMIPSRNLFAAIRRGRYTVVFSDVVRVELSRSPEEVQSLAESIENFSEDVEITPAAIDLQQAYIKAGIVTKKSLNDALHVAIATTSAVDAIVSWNFKHIVKLDKIKGYNDINVMHGYQKLIIISPEQVIHES